MNLNHLRMFCLVAEKGSFAVIAQNLQITPSTVSHAMKSLEATLGCRFFDRRGRKVLLNQAGEQFLSRVKPLVRELEESAESIRRVRKWGQSRLRVGAPISFCKYILPSILRELRKTAASTCVQVESYDTPELVSILSKGGLDLGIGLTPDPSRGLECRPLFRDELLLAMAPSHPLSAVRFVSRDELSKQTFILYQGGSTTVRLVEDYLGNLGIYPQNVMKIASYEAIKELVKAALGIGILAPWTAAQENKRGLLSLRPLGLQSLHRNWAAISLKGRPLNAVEMTFIRLCRQWVTALQTDRRDLSGRKPVPLMLVSGQEK